MEKAVFLDKDGTLINDIPYNVDPERIILSADSTKGLNLLQEAGYLLVVVSNQSGVARGYFTEEALMPVKTKLYELLANQGIRLNGFYYCPHHPDGTVTGYSINCNCRKPEPGMLLLAAKELNIDLSESWMIGDILNDVEAGNRAGCKTILIDNGNETEWIMTEMRIPQLKCATINEAATRLLAEITYERDLANV